MNPFYHVGRFTVMVGRIFNKPENSTMYWKELLRQMNQIGVESVPIIAMVAMFIGAVTAVQFAYQIQDFLVPLYYVGFIVRDSMIIEMAPTVSCMILAGKVGSNIASELGNMRITSQIDAMEIMGINTPGYLLGTKIVAALITIPALIVVAAFVGIIGGMLATVLSDISTLQEYERGLRAFFVPFNVRLMLTKGVVFSLLLSTVSCYQGYHVEGGAIEIGQASTRAVVFSNILILIADYFIAFTLLK
ncbi:ABC transporter permease [Sphingobacteriales bacterium UPWRP_1]|nr:ABC transporter permease [Sphingobacteriales bacterium TSM_CSM]PSJ72728.1 ABC transporter permease [Sphingobacteriales bacterium UPWRP_1]